jgi:hypothetical protein
MRQTAVEWLLNEIDMQYPEINVRRKEWMLEKAKEIEKEQIKDAFKSGAFYKGYELESEQYYFEKYENETIK